MICINNTWGKNFRISVFGESHGECIGVVLDGLPAGFPINFDEVRHDLQRRAPGRDAISTKRSETDEFTVMSGMLGGVTTGAPLMAMTKNSDTRSVDYEPDIPRPGHADLAAGIRYARFNDYRGGGAFSGRMTAAVVFAGAIAKQLLFARHEIDITARTVSICGETDEERWRGIILKAAAEGDSVGGIIECRGKNIPPGWGAPIFHSLESDISAMMFSIPAIKGVEFGDGFGFSAAYGSEVSDGMTIKDGRIEYLANHNGGINGGISNGAEIIFRAAVKPTPTISKLQNTVNLKTQTAISHAFKGRHDPCIVPRAVPVVEAGFAICLMEYIL